MLPFLLSAASGWRPPFRRAWVPRSWGTKAARPPLWFCRRVVVVSAPFGVLFLARAEPTILNLVLGAILIVSALQGMIPKLGKKRRHPVYVGVPCVLLSGALTGAFGTGAPPLVAFVSTQGYDRLRYAATV